jgi:hypothetical protein
MTEIFRSTRKCRTFEAFLQCRLRPLARRKHPAVIYGAHYPRGCVFWPEFSLDRYTYDSGWDI